MSKGRNDTTMGGRQRAFQTTHWTEIQRAKTHDEERRQASVNSLMQRYWKPVYWCLRRKGCSNDEAKDLTQGFFCEVVLGRELIQQADEAKGRFRTFLLTALNRYVTSVYRKENARKRRPATGLVSLETKGLPDMPAGEAGVSPEHAFHYAWATNILDQVLAQIQDEYCGSGRPTHWEVFRRKILLPIFHGAEEPSLSEICEKCGIASEKQASNMLITIKRRFAVLIRRVLRQYFGSDAQVDEEFAELLEILATGRAA
ncbi:MAG: sigma-70 family RNA polymerase sigma factor [Phycisphaerales bacterium]|nr:MAG: sigma-70 family RNA polymerase sigma factor [Phycisphaerales bacterium]